MRLFLVLLTGCTLQGSLGSSESSRTQPIFGATRWAVLAGAGDSVAPNGLARTSAGDIIVGGTRGERGLLTRRSASDGHVVWQHALTGDYSTITGVALHGASVLVTGAFMGTTDFGGQLQTALPAATDMFVASYDVADGRLAWVRVMGADILAAGATIAASDDGIYAGGWFRGVIDVGDGPVGEPVNWQGQTDGILVAYDHAGARRWGHAFTGRADIRAVSVAPDGEILVSGEAGPGVSFGGAPLPAGAVFARFGSDGAHHASTVVEVGDRAVGHLRTSDGTVIVSGARPAGFGRNLRARLDATGTAAWTAETDGVEAGSPVAFGPGFAIAGVATGAHADPGQGTLAPATLYLAAYDLDGAALDVMTFGAPEHANRTLQSLAVGSDGSLAFAVRFRAPLDLGTGLLTPPDEALAIAVIEPL